MEDELLQKIRDLANEADESGHPGIASKLRAISDPAPDDVFSRFIVEEDDAPGPDTDGSGGDSSTGTAAD